MTKEELREDPVLERIQKMIGFAEHNSRWLIAGAIVIIAVLVGVTMLHRAQLRSAQDATRYLADAQASYMRGNMPAAESQLRQVIDSYGGTPSGRMARVYLGDALRAQDRPEEALSAYQEAASSAKDNALLRTAALRGQAAALEDLGRYGESSQIYERVSTLAPFLKVDDLIGAGRTALKAGDAARATDLLKRATKMDDAQRHTEVSYLLAEAEASLD